MKTIRLLNEYHLSFVKWDITNNAYLKWLSKEQNLNAIIVSIKNDISQKEIELKGHQAEINIYSSQREEYDALLTRKNEYMVYCKMMNYDGLPFEILNKYLPTIETHVNSVLGSIADFKIEFFFSDDVSEDTSEDNATTDKKPKKQTKKQTKKQIDKERNIDVNICYNEKSYNIKLASGFEQFIINLAIRITLGKITMTAKT